MAKLFLPSLPVCPYCNTIYRYGDVKRLIFKKDENCYHCDKCFKVSKKKLLIMIVEFLLIYAITDILLICFASGISILILFIINVILVAVGFFMIPYYIQFVEKKK